MADLIIGKLHPTEPVTADVFRQALAGLTITAFDLTVNNSTDGVQIGIASGLADAHVPLGGIDPTDSSVDITQTQIIQHFHDSPGPLGTTIRALQSVATAVIVANPPAGHPEYLNATNYDLRLKISRNGSDIIDQTIDFNVVVSTMPILSTDQNDYISLPATAYAAIPAVSGNITLQVPQDGTAPAFDKLVAAVDAVLAKDPADGVAFKDRDQLTAAQSQQIAAEIVWDRTVYPPPVEPRPLAQMYTAPTDSDSDTDRQKFEGQLTSYHATHDSEATRLAKFVYTASAAIQCEKLSAGKTVPNAGPSGESVTGAPLAALPFPIIAPGTTPVDTTVILLPSFGPSITDQFIVPAAYFYALGFSLPTQIGVAQRYDAARFTTEIKTLQEIQASVTSGAITANETPITQSGAAINPAQAARRLHALGAVAGSLPAIPFESDFAGLVSDWLAYQGSTATVDTDFWQAEVTNEPGEYLALVLDVVTGDFGPLKTAITGTLGVSSVADLVAVTDQQWRDLFLTPTPRLDLLPPFTQPGTPQQRADAFIRFLHQFFTVPTAAISGSGSTPGGPPVLGVPVGDVFTRFSQAYSAEGGGTFVFGTAPDASAVTAAIADTLPGDPRAQAWLAETIEIINELFQLTSFEQSQGLQFSLMEALYSRGFVSTADVQALSQSDFQQALAGTVAYDFAAQIHSSPGPGGDENGEFQPVNPDGKLTDCLPPEHLSPFGPVAYLHEMLLASTTSTCEQPCVPGEQIRLGDQLATRRGPIGDLHATRADLTTLLPEIDLVNESLEALVAAVASDSGQISGAVYDTASDRLAGHPLARPGHPGHDPTVLFAAIPEHSAPAAVDMPSNETAAYAALRTDASAPALPYDEPLDVVRSYLCHLRTSRFAAMRRFRKEITEFVLDPDNEPDGFAAHLWRLPVRFDIALEFLGVSQEEYALLFRQDIPDSPANGLPALYQVYGFAEPTVHETQWYDIVLSVPEFLHRTGLCYSEFLDLARAGFVPFRRAGTSAEEGDENSGFPVCEPCCLDELSLAFTDNYDANDPTGALRRLVVFIRLWRILQHCPGPRITFTELAELATALQWYDGKTINPDFLRQLAALLMLLDELDLRRHHDNRLSHHDIHHNVHHDIPLLPLWATPTPPDWHHVVAVLLDAIEDFVERRHHSHRRGPEFAKVIADNLDPLSILAGFDPATPSDTWFAKPTHTLRFVEILGKIYASDFTIGEILFLFTAADHLDNDDPFSLPEANESLDDPLALPDPDEDDGAGEHSLWALRQALLDVHVSEEEVEHWDWPRIVHSLRHEFGYPVPTSGPDPLVELARHFFPEALRRGGYTFDRREQQFRTPLALADTSPLMWIAPPEGPFGYDESTQELWTRLPLRDSSVIAQLRELRPLREAEQVAVRNLYFAPRAALAPFAALFQNFDRVVDLLVQEHSEHERFALFRLEFALFHRRSRLIADHLAAHVRAATGAGEEVDEHSQARAWRMLRALLADENLATSPWEDDSGQPPATTWTPRPSGGAFAALLGLTGTGLLGEFHTITDNHVGEPIWRENRGPLTAFGRVRDEHNAPVPTVIPALDLELRPAQLRQVGLRNGFAFRNNDGEPLGGTQPFRVRWTGMLLVDHRGAYRFHAGAPTSADEEPDFRAAHHSRWRVTIGRGQRTWTVLNHDWPGEDAPGHRSESLTLRRGTYRITVDFAQSTAHFAKHDELHPTHTGFQLNYIGPDTGERSVAIPFDRLFRDAKDNTLGVGVEQRPPTADEAAAEDTAAEETDTEETAAAPAVSHIGPDEQAAAYLDLHYPSTLRDIRRTYQRAFKALLFAERFRLSARLVHGYHQSELGFLLDHPESFEGTSYFRTDESSSAAHHAWFDMDLLPVSDPYLSPDDDQRTNPSPKRQAALFDWWERIFDYCRLRAETQDAEERPPWLLFADVAEQQPDNPAELLRHLWVELIDAPLVLAYFDPAASPPIFTVGAPGSTDLTDERWAVRVWYTELWLRELRRHFLPHRIENARPALWVADDPGALLLELNDSGDANLTGFVQDGYLDSEPRRYADLTRLNDELRERARTALLAYLTGMDRVPLPWASGGFARCPQDLSDLLLQDVCCGIVQRANRIEDAVAAVQAFVQRARLGLEPSFPVSPAFAQLWDRRFGTFRLWRAIRRREIYRENWIEWDELRIARKSEAFRFLEEQIRSSTLTVPVPGGLDWWPATITERPPVHPDLVPKQAIEPAEIQLLPTPREGLGLLGTPEHSDRLSWLAPVTFGNPVTEEGNGPAEDTATNVPTADVELPLWLRAAVKLGTNFVRVAAAGLPPAAGRFVPRAEQDKVADDCCADCAHDGPAVVDEYYFWLAETKFFSDTDAVQNADVGVVVENDPVQTAEQTSDWHRPDQLPGLLNWEPESMVHLYWSRLHHGEFEPPRRSTDGLIISGDPGALTLAGRVRDSLRFAVSGGVTPVGFGDYQDAPPPGFRYDLATDAAVVLPLVAEPVTTGEPNFLGLAAYPFFAFVAPGARLVPSSEFSIALTVAGALRTHCRFDAALKWYELAYQPLTSDNTWARCDENQGARGKGESQDLPCCPSSPVDDYEARDRAAMLAYLETLLQWGEDALCRNSAEADQRATVVFETMQRILGCRPRVVKAQDDTGDPQQVATFVARPAPLNPRLISLYDRAADRLTLAHDGGNGWRLRGRTQVGDRSFWDDDPVVNGWRESTDPCELDCRCDGDCMCCCGPYRFTYLIQKAIELSGEVRSLGAQLLAAYEKGDAEALAALRSAHERQLLELNLRTRELQWRESDWQVQALGKTKEGALTRLRYYEQLIQGGLNAGETGYQALEGVSIASRTAGNVSEAIAQGIGIIPDIWVGVAGLGPLEANQLPVGSKLAHASFETAARILNALADIANTSAGLSLTEGAWDRRLAEWQLQVATITIEIDQIERQILAAERHRDAALRDLNNQQRQIEQSTEVQDFLRDKFTNAELYLFLQQETAALHRQMYELAVRTARHAQRAFNNERGHLARRFLPEHGWDNLHDGLIAGERLQSALRQMELAYVDENCREYELTKHLSLRLDFPVEFLKLQMTGVAEIEIPEWLFDLDYPGQYMRRIKNVSLSIPCVVGPYTGVHCRLTLLGSTTRIDPRLTEPPTECPPRGYENCGHEKCGCDRGYLPLADDPRLVRSFAATQAIATSSGQNDSGLFELDFRDERYLPFEFAGAVSRWRIELPPENNRFDFDTLGDVVLHLNYTAREGGDVLRHAANCFAQRHLPGAGLRPFDIRHDFPDDWYRLTSTNHGRQVLPLRLGREHFPFLTGNRDLRIVRQHLFVELADPDHRGDLRVRFVTEHDDHHRDDHHRDDHHRDDHHHEDHYRHDEDRRHIEHDVDCVASAEWPRLFHGVLDVPLEPLRRRGDRKLGVFHFPKTHNRISRLWLVSEFKAID